jgi:hypothetical protein
MHMFRKATEFEAFERVMVEAHQREPIRILAYFILSNHWHFVVWPERDGQLSHFFRWLAEFGSALSGDDPAVTMNGSGKRSWHFIGCTPSVGRVAHPKRIDPTPLRRASPRLTPAAK